ncbi:MAG: polymer-forming cytoskeletal protein [Hyphomicrobiaceae bacterium]|nr:polymer-forming cytoskeletal protein [Hyphomicrobiaceae bacterium]
MFGRSPNPDVKTADQASAFTPPTPPAPPQPGPSSTTRSSPSIIGQDLAIVGQQITVVSQSRVQIDGQVEGNVNGKEVIVGKTGRVTGTITANAIEVQGEVNGALKGATVTLHPTARVEGDIYHQTLAIAEGAQFDGRVRRPKDAAEITPNLDVVSLSQKQAVAAG